MPMPNLLYDSLFAPLAARHRPVLMLPDGRTLDSPAFLAMVHRAAGALAGLGVMPGDRVAVQVAKTPEALAVYGGAVALGAVFLPLNTAYTPDEVAYFVENARPALVLADPARRAALAPITQRNGARLMSLDATGAGDFADAMAAAPAAFSPVARGADDLAAILYTSGTTGRSKGAMLSHGNLFSNAETLVGAWRFTAGDVLLHALPIFHTHGLFVATNVALLSGAAMIFLPGFDVAEVMAHLPGATVLMGVPTFYTRLLDQPGFDRSAAAHMRLFISGSAPLLAETHAAFEARTGHRILERYGMTETNMNTSNPYEGARRAGTVGPALPGVEVRVTQDGAPLPQGAIGMVEVRGPNVFQGYWQMPDKTAEDMRADGFFITGDLGRLDADGYLTIVGREKDMVISGGYNVYPKEVESLLDEMPGVLESAVVGLPHPDLGEAVFAVIVPARGAAPDIGAIDAALRGKLAGFKRPRGYHVADALPRNTMGKVQKTELRKAHAARFQQEG
jgi:malonyl-CoA/methylmalonyl-CoA synthetase